MEEQLWFGKYQPLRLLSANRDTEIFLALHTKLFEKRILKRMSKRSSECSMLKAEAERMKNLKCPNIPIIFDIEEDEIYFYIIEEYVEGESLSDYIQNHGPISEKLTLEYSICLCNLLEFMHGRSCNLLHLDLQPANIIICGRELKLIDFGSSVGIMNADTQNVSYGTKGFSAPEQYYIGEADERTDIYALGCLIRYMLTGNKEDCQCSKELKKIIECCTMKSQSKRYRYVKDVKEKLVTMQVKKNSIVGKLVRGTARRSGPRHGTIVIGVIGTHRAVGVTHITVLLANYLSSICKKNVAVLEQNEHHDLQYLDSRNLYEREEEVRQYTIYGVDYYPEADFNQSGRLQNQAYDYCILDLGEDLKKGKEELLRCDVKLIITDSSAWHIKQRKCIYEMEQFIEHWENWHLLLNHSMQDDIRGFKKSPMRAVCMCFAPDPFRVTKSVIQVFQSLLD